jgi:hypothetical protein
MGTSTLPNETSPVGPAQTDTPSYSVWGMDAAFRAEALGNPTGYGFLSASFIPNQARAAEANATATSPATDYLEHAAAAKHADDLMPIANTVTPDVTYSGYEKDFSTVNTTGYKHQINSPKGPRFTQGASTSTLVANSLGSGAQNQSASDSAIMAMLGGM